MADIGRALAGLQQGVGAAMAELRKTQDAVQRSDGKRSLLEQKYERLSRDVENLASALSSIKAEGSGAGEPHIRYIEQIPGRRIPFDLTVNIPIGANVTAMQQAVTTISQDGPFVAVARYAVFQSAYVFTQTDPETQNRASFQGRSYGRFRPISSVADLLDGSPGYQPTVGAALPGLGSGINASPSNHSSFRSMEFDGVIQFLNQGTGFLRQNVDIPSAFYMQEINSPFLLGALDFFERGETLQWRVTPTHTNNPPYGNVAGFASGGFYPFLDSQYDVQEGILDPQITDQETDPISRLPEGILTIGFHGYRIIQPPGTVSLI
jgi:hypothetical protein